MIEADNRNIVINGTLYAVLDIEYDPGEPPILYPTDFAHPGSGPSCTWAAVHADEGGGRWSANLSLTMSASMKKMLEEKLLEQYREN